MRGVETEAPEGSVEPGAPKEPGGRSGRGRTRVAWLVAAAMAGLFCYRTLAVALPALSTRLGDFDNYYAAAGAMRSGASPYTIHNFDYPPLVACLVLPVAGLPYASARVAWFAVAFLSLVAAGWLLWRTLGGGPRPAVVVATLWGLAGTVAANLVLGQVTPLILALTVVAWWLWARGRARPAGLASLPLALAAALKIWPALLLGVFALGRRWRLLGAGVGVALAALALSWLPVLALPAPHRPASAGYWMGSPALLNLSLPAVALRLADPPRSRGELPLDWLRGNNPQALALPASRRALGVAVALLVLAAGGLLLWRAVPAAGSPAGDLLTAAALTTLALVASPIAWYHYQLMQLPGLALLATRWAERRRWTGLAGLGLLTLGLTWSQTFALTGYIRRFGLTAAAPALLWLASSLVPLLGLVLFGLFLYELRGMGRRSTPAPV